MAEQSGESDMERWLSRALWVAVLLATSLAAPVASAQDQVFPSINFDCVEAQIEFEFSATTDSAQVHCTVENPTAYSEDVTIGYDTASIDADGPNSITVESGATVSFEVTMLVDNSVAVGTYELTVSAQVTSAVGGIPVGFITNNETYSLDAIVPEFIDCGVTYGQSSLTVEAGEDVSFSASYSCESNRDQSLKVELHIVSDGSSQEEMWPSGFNDVSEQNCEVQISNGNGMSNCQFLVTTPANLADAWNGCLVVVDERTVTAQSCQQEDSLTLTVNAKESGVSDIGFGQNGTLLEDLGISEDDAPLVIGGTAGVLLLVMAVVLVVRRRG